MAATTPTGMLATAPDPVLTTQDGTQPAAPIRPEAPETNGSSGTSPGMLSDWYSSYMGNAPPPPVAAAATPQAGTTAWTPGKDSTVQGQLTSVLDAGGPLQDRAATKAAQIANGRGLLNSSMAVTAGQAALYDAALPIAQQDANINAQAGQFNANASNTAALTNAGISADVGKFNAGSSNTAALQANDIRNQNVMQQRDLASRYDLASMDVQSRAALQAADAENQQKLQAANAALQVGLQASDNAVKQSMQAYQLGVQQAMAGQDNDTKLAVATLDANTQTTLADINNRFRNQLQASQSMASSYQSMVDGITRVMIDPNMDVGAKQAAINNLTTLYNNTLSMQSDLTGLDLGTLLTPGEFEPVGSAETASTAGQSGSSGTPASPYQDFNPSDGG